MNTKDVNIVGIGITFYPLSIFFMLAHFSSSRARVTFFFAELDPAPVNSHPLTAVSVDFMMWLTS